MVASLFQSGSWWTNGNPMQHTHTHHTQKLSMTEIYYKFNICLFNQSMNGGFFLWLRYFIREWLLAIANGHWASIMELLFGSFVWIECGQHKRGKRKRERIPSDSRAHRLYFCFSSNYVHILGLYFSNTLSLTVIFLNFKWTEKRSTVETNSKLAKPYNLHTFVQITITSIYLMFAETNPNVCFFFCFFFRMRTDFTLVVNKSFTF